MMSRAVHLVIRPDASGAEGAFVLNMGEPVRIVDPPDIIRLSDSSRTTSRSSSRAAPGRLNESLLEAAVLAPFADHPDLLCHRAGRSFFGTARECPRDIEGRRRGGRSDEDRVGAGDVHRVVRAVRRSPGATAAHQALA